MFLKFSNFFLFFLFLEPNLKKKNVGATGCTPASKCSRCEGDCDTDDDCTSGLKCKQRDNNEKTEGCNTGGGGDIKGYDFCYDEPTLTKNGAISCHPTNQCDRCQGDCDQDADCKSGMTCRQRDGTEKVKGCLEGGTGDISKFDYCFDEPTLTTNGAISCHPTNKCSRCQGDCDSDADCARYVFCLFFFF